ncbi:unnamed protein product [Cuscuta epithymum]|uniref:Uncharacterized protein n=1 Tax=Cuscuta epithymum TaxID=186058 RepID=A0AAV0FX95_9ASTE|nr:unnamed protein product [Cuscuta epithymum]
MKTLFRDYERKKVKTDNEVRDPCCDFRMRPSTVLIISLDWMIQIPLCKLGWIEDFIIYNFHEGSFVKFRSFTHAVRRGTHDRASEARKQGSYCQSRTAVRGGTHAVHA